LESRWTVPFRAKSGNALATKVSESGRFTYEQRYARTLDSVSNTAMKSIETPGSPMPHCKEKQLRQS
jgi:hypothetical protein